MIENNLFQLFVYLFLFSQDHVTFPLNGGGIELRVLENVGKDIDRLGNIGVEALGIVDGIFTLSSLLAKGPTWGTIFSYRGVGV